MKLLNPIRLSVGLAALFVAQAGWAAGTLAGTDVSNTATLTYSVGTTTQAPVTSNTTVFEVDRKVDLNVTGAALSTPVIANPSETAVQLSYTLTNEGNSTQNFAVNVSHIANSTTTDDFDAGAGTTATPTAQTACTVTISGANITTVTGLIGQANPIYVEDMAPDDAATVTVECVMPNKPDVVDGDVSIIDVSATALEPTTHQNLFATAPAANAALSESATDVESEVDTVFADAAGITGTHATDSAVRNATHSATHSYEIESPELTVTKNSAVVADPVTCNNSLDSSNNYGAYSAADAVTASCANAKRIPGAVIEYTINIANASATVPTDVSISDLLQADVTYVPNSVTKGGTAFADSDASVTFSDPTLTVGAITVPANGNVNVTFRVIVD